MKAFEIGNNVTGTFPSTVAKNVSGSGATDGTALIADWINNFWGMMQDALNRVGLTPSGVVEAFAAETGTLPLGTTSTQMRTAMQMGAWGNPGEFVLWGRSQSPATVGARILLLQGQTIAIASYPDLVAATYCGNAVNNTSGVPFYKSSDAGGVTRSTSGTYFTLPDCRGVVLRGVDTGNVHDPGGSTRGAGTPNGSIQLDAMQGHYHGLLTGATSLFGFAASGLNFNVQTATGATANNLTTIGGPVTDGTHGTPRIDSETRMVNVAVYIGIRY